MRRSTIRLRALLSIARRRCSGRGMNSFPAQQKGAAIADRLSAIACSGWTTQKPWASMSFIFRRSIPLVTPTARGGTIRSPASRMIQGCRGRSAAKPVGIRRSSLRSERWPILIGCKKRCANAGWRLRSISPSIARPIILTSKNTPIGSTSGQTARSSTRKIRRKSTRTFIR